MTKFPMTAAGYSALQDELNQRMAVERPRLIQRMQEAIADDSNLAENSEYHAAQAGQLVNEARIIELEDKLARAEVIDVSKLSGNTIKFGATVTLIDADTDEKKVWRIVGEPEANANSGKISVNSPIARAWPHQQLRSHRLKSTLQSRPSKQRKRMRSPIKATRKGMEKAPIPSSGLDAYGSADEPHRFYLNPFRFFGR